MSLLRHSSHRLDSQSSSSLNTDNLKKKSNFFFYLNLLKLIETVWKTKFTFYFWAIRKLQIVRKYTGNRPIAPQLVSCDQNNSQIRDPRQILDRIGVFKKKSMTWPPKKFSELYIVDFFDFRRFSGISDGNMNYILYYTRITKIGFFFASAQWLLSYGHIQKPEVQNGAVFFKSEKWDLFSN